MRTKALVLALSLAVLAPAGAALAADPPAAKPFATVGDTVISSADFQRALSVAMRKKYYHAKPPEGEYQQFQREVGDEVVNRVLLLAEARRRGIQPDAQKIAETIAGYDQQYGGSDTWKTSREKKCWPRSGPSWRAKACSIAWGAWSRPSPRPRTMSARAFYDKNKALFVEPEQVKLSLILLKVDPSSPQAVWNSAKEEGQRIHKRLKAGADFAELAKLHSGDASATQGGQMEYTHSGMLPETLAATVEKLKSREISEPVQLLQGIAILRLDDRKSAQQRPFDAVRERAGELWQREEGESRWKKLIADLRRATPIRIDESQYVPLPATAEKSRAG